MLLRVPEREQGFDLSYEAVMELWEAAMEAGAALEFAGFELSEAPLGLSARYDVAAARTPADLAVLRKAQDAVD